MENENTVIEAEVIEKTINKKEKKTRKFGIGMICAFLVYGTMCSFGGAYVATNYFGQQQESAPVEQISTVTEVTKVVYQNQDGTYTTESVAALVADSVVEIQTESVTTSSYWGNYVSSGAGSGVILSEDGYIVTNNHVIDSATSIKVILNNHDTYDATLIGTDSTSDIAVIKIEATGLKAAKLGSSASLNVGQAVVAIGNPLGTLGGTVTEGIISAKDREISIDGNTMTLLQTSAAINPGNSGGGLFNMKGELIGIVNAKSSSSSESIEGLGFAIPIDTANKVISDLMTYGYVTGRPQLGIKAVDVSNYYTAFRYGFDVLGVGVAGVTVDDSPLQKGDLIIKIDDETVTGYSSLSAIIKKHQVGDEVTITVIRDNREQTVKMTLSEYKPVVETNEG